MEIFLVVLGAVLGLLLAVLVQPLVADPIQNLVVRLFGGFPLFHRSQSLAGAWHLWDWPEDRPALRHDTRTEQVQLFQVGKRVYGRFHSRDRDYAVKGMVRDNRFFTGTWRQTMEGQAWHGVFQFRIGFEAKTMSGRWLGVDKGNEEIGYGEWEWKRPEVKRFPSDEEGRWESA